MFSAHEISLQLNGKRRVADIKEIIAKAEKIKRQMTEWEKAGHFSPKPLSPQMPERFRQSQTTTQAAWINGPQRESLYVWLHIDEVGEPFYAGRGRGATAWEHHGGVAWEWFVRERQHGSYGIVILAAGLTADQSEQLLGQALEIYGLRLLVQSNPHRGMDYEALQRYHVVKDELRPLYDRVPKMQNRAEQLALAQQAQALQYKLDLLKTDNEKGRFGEVLRDMGALMEINQFFIRYIIEELVAQGRLEAAQAALAEHMSYVPMLANTSSVNRLQKIVERGTFKRRPRPKRSTD